MISDIQLDALGDDFDRISLLYEHIEKKIEAKGLEQASDAWVGRALTETEHLIYKVTQFFSCVSNNGRVYPHLEFGLEIRSFLVRIGALGCVKVLDKLHETLGRANSEPEKELLLKGIEKDQKEIEADAEGDFEWAELLFQYAKKHKSDVSFWD